MNKMKKVFCVIVIILLQFHFTSCADKNIDNSKADKLNHTEKYNISKKYSEIIITKITKNNVDVFNVNNVNLEIVQSVKDVSDIDYSVKNNVISYIKFKSHGKNLTNNYIEIFNATKGESYYLKDQFFYGDILLSKEGTNIAYRSFQKDSYDSGNGLNIYDISNKKIKEIPKNIILSGNLYNWISDKEIWYYGKDNNKSGYGNIYCYNVEKETNKEVYKNFKGYCTYFIPCNNKEIFYLENDSDKSNLYYCDISSKNKNLIDKNFESIYDSIYDVRYKNIFFIGKKNDENNIALYRYNIKFSKLTRITYDLPSNVDKNGGIAIDNTGKVYFSGYTSTEGKNDVYVYDNNSNTTQLVTSTEGMYHVYNNKK